MGSTDNIRLQITPFILLKAGSEKLGIRPSYVNWGYFYDILMWGSQHYRIQSFAFNDPIWIINE